MKKRYVLITAMLLMVSMLLAGTAQALTANELMKSAGEKMSAATGYETKSNIDLVMSADGEQVAIAMTFKAKFRLDPLCVKMDATIDVYGEKEKVNMYIQIEDDQLVTYVVEGKEVLKTTQPLSDDALAQLTGTASPEKYLDSYKKVSYVGNDRINGKNVYVLTAQLDATAMEGQIKEQMEGLSNTDNRVIDSILKNMKDVPVTFYIDQNTHNYVRMEIDMTNLMNKVFKALGSDFANVKIDKYSMTIDYSNINKVKPFSIPSSIIKKAAAE